MRDLNKQHFAVFVDWTGTLHIQFRIREKFLDCIKVTGRGIYIVSIKRRKAEKRGVRYVPAHKQADIVGQVAATASMEQVPVAIRELLGQVYEGVSQATMPEGEGTMPGCPARTSADAISASTSRAGVASP